MSSSTHSQKVHSMFSSIASKYDVANGAISMGMHHGWRKLCVEWSEAKPGDKVLDLATGTGDLAIEFKKTLGATSEVLGTDYCAPMMETAPAKAKSLGFDISFEVADATHLQYEDERFHITSISFGLRNVDNRPRAIKEMARVTKPNGKVMILDTGVPSNPIILFFYKFYFAYIMPLVGGLLSRNLSAYKYLFESAGKFPCGEQLKQELLVHGKFKSVEYKALMFGSAYLYKATK